MFVQSKVDLYCQDLYDPQEQDSIDRKELAISLGKLQKQKEHCNSLLLTSEFKPEDLAKSLLYMTSFNIA